MGKGKPETTTTNQTQVNTPWAPAEPYLKDLLTSAGKAYAATPKTGPNADQTAAIDWFRAAAPKMSTGVDQLRGLATDELSGKYLDPASNPYIKGAVSAAIDPLQRGLDARMLSIGDAAQMAGAFGGDRQGILQGQALGDFNRDAMNTAASIYAQNYSNERQLQHGAGQSLAQANALSTMGGQTLDQAGNEEMQLAQNAPWTGLDKYAQILQSASPYGTQTGTQVKTTSPATPGGFTSFLQGALGAAQVAALFI